MDTLLPIYVFAGLGLVAISVWFRTARSPFDADTSASWRFGFFVVWTLSVPLVWLCDWWGPEVNAWFGGHGWKPPKEIESVPHLTHGRKVISDLWAAVAVVLVALAWNKPGGS